jgi:hypothetical protein
MGEKASSGMNQEKCEPTAPLFGVLGCTDDLVEEAGGGGLCSRFDGISRQTHKARSVARMSKGGLAACQLENF